MATLVYSDADGVDRSFALGPDPVTVGRAAECAIRSDDPRVSRMHARFFVEQGALWVEDLGSSNGIYVGPNKVTRAPVPTGEIILVGSLVIRLLPASGTLPPPLGLHGTLASWLDLERKARAAVEEERDAFAKRVGELHEEIAAAQQASSTMNDGKVGGGLRANDVRAGIGYPSEARGGHAIDASSMGPTTLRDGSPYNANDLPPIAEAVRLRDEAEARAVALESALAAMQDEMQVLRKAAAGNDDGRDLLRLRDELAAERARCAALTLELSNRAEWSNADVETMMNDLKAALDEEKAARTVADSASNEAVRESLGLRQELDQVRRESNADLEIARLELAKTRESKQMVDAAAGVQIAEKLAEADLVIEDLKHELEQAKRAVEESSSGPEARIRELTELAAVVTGRAEKAEKELGAAQIRAQGAERNLSHANAQAAKAETRASQLEHQLLDAEERAKNASAAVAELAEAREKVAALEKQAKEIVVAPAPRATPPPLPSAPDARTTKLMSEIADLTKQVESSSARLGELEKEVVASRDQLREADVRAAAAKTEISTATQKLADAEQRANALQLRVDQLAKAEAAIAAAAKAKADAAERSASADARVQEAERRSEDAEKRGSAADTMAKAMAKDVAEALRRAADSDMKARAVARELDNAHRRADKAEALSADVVSAIREAERRATDAETKVADVRAELEAKIKTTEDELGGKLASTKEQLTAKVEAVQRELAAERSTAMSLVDRKTQLERELADARTTLPAAIARADSAEQKVVEHEVQIETLQDRILDLESGMAVSETAQQASLAEAREDIKQLKIQLAASQQTIQKAEHAGEQLRTRVGELETQLAAAEHARATAEIAARDARNELDKVLRAAELRDGGETSIKEQLDDALSRAADAERKVDALSARAEAADLAQGRAGALQRQLDEAISKLAWMEREAQTKARSPSGERAVAAPIEASDALVNDRIQAAESRTKEAENRTKEADNRAKDYEARLAEAERRTQVAAQKQADLAEQVSLLDRRLQETTRSASADANRRLAQTQSQLAQAQTQLAQADERMQLAERSAQGYQHKLVEAQNRVAALEHEVASADNVRSFAAETEREIAQLQRERRDLNAKLTQTTLERDRLALQVRDIHGDSETTNRRAPIDPSGKRTSGRRAAQPPQYDPEATAALDVARIEAMIARQTELEQKVVAYEREVSMLRAQINDRDRRLAEAEGRLRVALENDGAESTRTGSELPVIVAEHVTTLWESIDSLRANMRAASDETAVMPQSDSVLAVASAVSQAAEHIERARVAVRALAATIGLNG